MFTPKQFLDNVSSSLIAESPFALRKVVKRDLQCQKEEYHNRVKFFYRRTKGKRNDHLKKMDQQGQPGPKQFLKLDNVIFIVAELLFELRKVVKRIYDAKRVLRFITLYYTSY